MKACNKKTEMKYHEKMRIFNFSRRIILLLFLVEFVLPFLSFFSFFIIFIINSSYIDLFSEFLLCTFFPSAESDSRSSDQFEKKEADMVVGK